MKGKTVSRIEKYPIFKIAGSEPACPAGRDMLEELYARFNRREYVHPDPLEFLYSYEHPRDREIVGLLASSLAYGRVAQILKSVESVLRPMGSSPADFVLTASSAGVARAFRGFKHRFTTGDEIALLLGRVKKILHKYGSLEASFTAHLKQDAITVLPALAGFAEELGCGADCGSMFLPSPSRGSACKRLNLFLRWMVRRDDVDLGVWRNGISPAKLIVPLDIHMHRISLGMGLTERKQADMQTALEVTAAFRSIRPGDPVRYDFSLTRLGILNGIE